MRQFANVSISSILPLAALLLLVVSDTVRAADTYVYINRQGTVVMTDSRNSIPKEYLKEVKIIKDAVPPKKESAPGYEPNASEVMQAVVPQPGTALAQRYGATAAPAAYVAAILILLYMIRKYSVMMGLPQIGMLFFVIVSLVAGIYFYKRYADHALQTYQALKSDAEKIKLNVEKRETMTDKSLQGMKQ